MAAPALVRGAGAVAGAEVGGAAAGTAAKAGKSAGAAKAAAPTGTAAGRASELRASGTSRSQAHKALRDEFGGTPAETDALLDEAGLVDQPADPGAQQQSRRSGPSRPSPALRSVKGAAEAGGGALLGALGYVLALAYLRDGKDGVKAWLSAKFLNKVTR